MTSGRQRVSEVYKLSGGTELQRATQWPSCVYNKILAVCSMCTAFSPRTKLIIQMAKMINPCTRHFHVKIYLLPAAQRLGSTQLVTSRRKVELVNSPITRLCRSFQRDQKRQDGNFGDIKSAQWFHRILIVRDVVNLTCRCLETLPIYMHLSWLEPWHICGFHVTQQKRCDGVEWVLLWLKLHSARFYWLLCRKQKSLGNAKILQVHHKNNAERKYWW